MDWQQILVYLIVAGAALYLLRGYFGKARKTGCGGCHGCPAPGPAPGESGHPSDSSTELVQLELKPPQRGSQNGR